jgi:hypothetical protein
VGDIYPYIPVLKILTPSHTQPTFC